MAKLLLCSLWTVALFFISTVLIYFTTRKIQSDILVYRVAGNLRPSTKIYWEKITRAPLVLQCAHTTCTPQPSLNLSQHINLTVGTKCPSYFKWIHEDFRPWKRNGITKGLLASAQTYASFRVVIIKNKLFLEPFHPCYQTRAFFTVWGLLQLLKLYPGLVPDVDLMFSCEDQPRVSKWEFSSKIPPPILRYCTTPDHFDVPFPDWSFWGWPELSINGWDEQLLQILNVSNAMSWGERRSVAQWKGNPYVAGVRMDLLGCNSSAWSTEIYIQDWIQEGKTGFSHSKLPDQCNYRFKIYVEGSGWSVSQKYILACGSLMLSISPVYHDFFSRGLIPLESYWPVNSKQAKMCKSLKFAVDWGNEHPQQAKAIGKGGQRFISEDVSMKHVYDYMLHILRRYAELQRFEPVVPDNAAEVCSDAMLCLADPIEKSMMQVSSVKDASKVGPCMLNTDETEETTDIIHRKQVENLEKIRKWEDGIAS